MLYKEIIKILNLDEKKDVEAAKNLSKISQEGKINILNLKCVEEKIANKNVIVFGAGPSLIYDLEQLMKLKNFYSFVKICADGAAKALVERKIFPDFIVSDLDGDISVIKKANENNAILLIHAHGDNINTIRKHTLKFKNLILTVQTNLKLKNLHNFGGFTDGDRALFFTMKFKPKVVILAGMDFGKKVGKYSKKIFGKRLKFKLKKLEVGKRMIEEKCKGKSNVYDFTKNGCLNIKRTSIDEIEEM